MAGSSALRRSLLFVPGAERRKLERAADAGADALVLDLEDAVSPDRKDEARALVADWLRSAPDGDVELAVRVNAPGTPWFEQDLAAIVGSGAHAVMLPKCESAEGVTRAAAALAALDAAARVRILALVETASGVTHAPAIAAATGRVDALCFGHADFSLDMGLSEPDPAAGVVLHARCSLAIAARSASIAPIDTVFLDVRDEAGFRAAAQHGLRLGFEGKLCIHPAQVAIANEVHTPTGEQVEKAREVVDGWRRAQAEGLGVFALDGKMVDGPVVAVHERILERARRAGVLEGS